MTHHNIHPHAAECPRRQDAPGGRAEQARHPFTPEPWESDGLYVRAKGRCVAKLDWDIRDATDEANARLIAKAPELYAWMERVLGDLSDHSSEEIEALQIEGEALLAEARGAQ